MSMIKAIFYAVSPQNTVRCWVYVTRQITSRRIAYSEFIPHSLLHSHNLQSHCYNYCHGPYHNCISYWSHCHSLDTIELVAVGLDSVIPRSTLTRSWLITDSVFFTLPIHSLQLHSATSWFTLSLLITDPLINPQSDNGQRASFPCCVVTLFTDCLSAVVTRLACCLTSCLPVLLGNAARVVYSSIATSVLRLGSLRLYSARHGETPLEEGGGVYRVMRRPRHNTCELTFNFNRNFRNVIFYFTKYRTMPYEKKNTFTIPWVPRIISDNAVALNDNHIPFCVFYNFCARHMVFELTIRCWIRMLSPCIKNSVLCSCEICVRSIVRSPCPLRGTYSGVPNTTLKFPSIWIHF
jgi:hypothetical protein